MKTTVKLAPLLGLVVQQSPDGFSISFAVERCGKTDFHVNMTPDESGVLIFALERALDARREAVIKASSIGAFLERVGTGGVRCHGDLCAGGQVKCPSPAACGFAAAAL